MTFMKNQKQPKDVSPKKTKDQRLALDIGTNSIGWAIYGLDKNKKPINIVGTGVRIFPSGRKDKDYTTLNATRRVKRLQRRQRDRYLQRRTYLLSLLRKHGLFPEDVFSSKKLEKLNPYELRARGLDEKLDIHHFGRALFHINQKRGFKSNRKSGDIKEDGLINQSIKASKVFMEECNARTYGEFLWKRLKKMDESRRTPGSQQDHWILARKAVGAKQKDNYAVYAKREMMVDEFNKLWGSQAQFHEKLKDKKIKDDFFRAIFFQRKLKKPIVGKCFLTGEKRIPKASPYFQKFRTLKELNNLAYMDSRGGSHRILDLERGINFRDEVIKNFFSKKNKVTFEQLKKQFKEFFKDIENFSGFNLEAFKREFLEGDKTSCILRKILKNWDQWGLEVQDRFIELLEGESEEGDFMKDDDEVLEDLKKFCEEKNFNISKDILEKCLSKVNQLPNGHGSYSKEAIKKIMPFLEKGEIESEAVSHAGLGHHSDRRHKGDLTHKLPEYQEVLKDHCVEMSLKLNSEKSGSENKYIRIPNPTVHIAFNQLRLVVNDIIRIYGKPIQVCIETARDLPLGAQTKKELEKNYETNKKKKEEARKFIKDLGLVVNRDNIFRYRLWKEQKETCVYSGKKIPSSKLFTAEMEVDHILPYSKTLDDGFSNKVLVYKSSNQNKSNQTPFEFFSSDTEIWEKILQRVKELPKNKQWRFNKNAMEKFLNGENDFLARQINDTRYISKYAKEYLERVCKDVWTVRGQTTSIFRRLLQHEEKTRDDHRNHAKDALIVGLIDRSFVKRISDIAKNIEGRDKERLENVGRAIKKNVPLPWASFKEDAKNAINGIVVSHRKRTKKEGQLHNETAYGISPDIDNFSKPVEVIHYIDIMSFFKKVNKNKKDKKKIIEKIVSKKIQQYFLNHLKQNESLSKEDFLKYHKDTGVRRFRFKENETVIPVENKLGKVYKSFSGENNYAIRLFEGQKGKWDVEVIDRFNANQKDFKPISKKVRLMKNDMFYFEKRFWRLVKFDRKKTLTFLEHFVSGNPDILGKSEETKKQVKRVNPAPFQKLKPGRVDISPCGVVKITPFDLRKPEKYAKKAG